nr:hemagglutinin repeat-containing protein [Gluconacetobacter entanii]
MKGGITQVKSLSSLFEEGKTPKGNIDLIAVQSNIGFDLEKSSMTLTTGTVQGSTAAAGNTLAVTATGGVPTDSQSGNIVATASQLSGQDVTLTAPGQVALQAGYDTTHEVASSKSIEASVGASASIGTKGAGVSIEGEFGASKTNTNAASSTAVDSTVSGTDNVTIANATGTTTLNGAEISGGSIDVATKDLTITTAQDTSGYNSKTTGIDASFSVPVWGAGDIGGSASFSHTTVKDSYASTEATQSGLYAGSGGLDVTASGTTTLNGGVIESTAVAALNQLSTGTLVANDTADHADATVKTMGYQANVMNPEGATTDGRTGSSATAIGAGMAANAGGLLGAATRKDASSVTQSAIGSNVQIAAGSTSGDLSRSPSTSSHPLTNTFDAQQMQNELQVQQVGSQVVGQVGDMVSTGLESVDKKAFGEGGVGRAGLEAAGNAVGATLGRGNVLGEAVGVAWSRALYKLTDPIAVSMANSLFLDDPDAQKTFVGVLTNSPASGEGALGGMIGGATAVGKKRAGTARINGNKNAVPVIVLRALWGYKMSVFKNDILALCREAIEGYDGWEFVSDQFRNKSLKHTTLVVEPGLRFDRVGPLGEVMPFPVLFLDNKKTMRLYKKILGTSVHTSRVTFSDIRGSLNMLPEFLQSTPRFIQNRAMFIEAGGSDKPYWRDANEFKDVIKRIFLQGVAFFESHYNFNSEKDMLEELPARYAVTASGGYKEYEQERGVMLCIVRCILGDFEFVKRYRSDEYKTVFPKMTEDLDKIIACLPQMKKSWQEKGCVSV